MKSEPEHSDDDSFATDAEFPPFVEAVPVRRAPAGNRSDDVSADVWRAASNPGRGERSEFAERLSPVLDRLGHWVIEREIGRGGMGIVYAAVHEDTKVHAALKFLPATGGLDQRRLDRFRQEAEIIQRLAHPNIVRLHSVEHVAGHHFLVMQLIDGISLDRVVGSISTHNSSSARTTIERDQRPSQSKDSSSAANDEWLNEKLFGQGQDRFRYIATLIQQAAQAMSYAHSQRVVHRDVKPSNLLVDRNDVLWIADFGLAQIQGEHGLTATGDLLGTLRYMSPEQAMASRVTVDHRTDVYSLGATLYELLCGDAAFQADDRKELLRQVLFDEPTALKKKDADIPVPLQIIAEKAMRKDPRQRYSTAGEMADDLFRYLSDSPIRARPMRFWEPALRWCRRNPALAVSLLTVVTLIVVLAAGRFIYIELDQRHEQTLTLLQRTASAERESQAFARLRDVARYRQTGLAGLRDRMTLLELDANSLSESAKTELRNEWLSCMARADWSFTRSIPCASPIAALDPSGEFLAELADPAGAQQICIRSLANPSSSTLCAPAGFDIKAIWFSRAGKFLVATDLQGNWQIFRTRDGFKLFDIPQLALGCDLSDATEQIVFWHVTPVVMLATLNGDVSTPPFQTFDLTSPASFVRFSPDGSRLAMLDRPGSSKLTLMNTSDGRVTGVQPAHQALILAWSPDGQLIAMPNQSGNITIREVVSSRIVSTLSSNESVISGITWHPSGNYLITTSWAGETLLRHVWTGRTLIRSHESLDAIAFSEDGQRIGWQFQSGSMKIAEWSPGHVIDLPWNSQNHTELPAGICIHPDGRLATVYSLAGCQLFDLETASVLHRIPLEGTLAAEFSDAGDSLVVLTRTAAMHWPIRNGVGEDTVEFSMGPPLKVPVPSLQNGVIAAGGRTALVRTTAVADRLTLLQLSDGAELWQAGESAPGLDVARPGPFAVRRGWRASQAEVYDFRTGNKLAVLHVGFGAVPSASPDSKYFVSTSLHQLQFWNPQTWQPLDAIPLDAPVVGANAMFHPLESLMVVRLMPSRLGLIDPATRNVIARIDELQDYWNTGNAFSADGEYFTELSGDPGGARGWKLGRMRRTLAQHGLDWGRTDSAATQNSTTPPSADATARPLVVRLKVTDAVQPGPGDSLRSARDELQATPSDPRLQNMVAWRLLLAPAELRNDIEALELARFCNAAVSDSAAYRNTLGLACYRNGLYAEAEQLLLKNLRTSRPEDLTLDLIILSMIAWCNHQSAASDAFLTWAENNFAEHPPADEVGLNEIQRLFVEREDLTQKTDCGSHKCSHLAPSR